MEFVSERVASIIVKHLCNDMIVKVKVDMMRNFKESVLKEETKEKYDITERKVSRFSNSEN